MELKGWLAAAQVVTVTAAHTPKQHHAEHGWRLNLTYAVRGSMRARTELTEVARIFMPHASSDALYM